LPFKSILLFFTKVHRHKHTNVYSTLVRSGHTQWHWQDYSTTGTATRLQCESRYRSSA